MKKHTLFDYLFLLRPSIMVAVWTFFFAGVYLGYRMNGIDPLWSRYNLHHIAYTLFLYTLLMGGSYVLNQIADVDTDRLNNKLFILSGGHISIRNAYIYMYGLYFVSLTLLLLTSSYTLNMKILFFASAILGVLYSAKPFSLKRRPFWDLAANAFGYGYIAVIIGYESTGYRFFYTESLIMLPYFLAMSAVFINTTVIDYEGDVEVNARTTGVFLGKKKAALLSAILMAGAVVSSVLNGDYVALAASAPSVFLFALAAVRHSRKTALISVKYSSPIMTVVLGIIFPYFFLLSLMVLMAMKIYYKRRFGYDYP